MLKLEKGPCSNKDPAQPKKRSGEKIKLKKGKIISNYLSCSACDCMVVGKHPKCPINRGYVKLWYICIME